MPMFYFDVPTQDDEPDFVGTEFPDVRSAQAEAVRLAGGSLRDYPDIIVSTNAWQVVVRDEFNRQVFTLVISADGELKGDPQPLFIPRLRRPRHSHGSSQRLSEG